MRNDETTLLDIQRAAFAMLDFIKGYQKDAFLKDEKTRSAVLYQLLVIGEAVKRLSPEFKNRYSEIPWSLIAGMRNHLIHGYDSIDWMEVWKTVTTDIPALLDMIEPLLPNKH